MKKVFAGIVFSCFCLTAFLSAQEGYREIWNIPYYETLAVQPPENGDETYRQERCRLDLYLPPESDEKFPVAVWFHSGGLTAGGKYIPAELKDQGIGIVAVNYRLSSDRAKCPDYLNDAAASTAWVLEQIASYGGDVNRIYVSGHSAGGYLTMMLALDPRWLAQFGHQPSEIAGYFSISGQATTHFQILNERHGVVQVPSNPAEIDEFAPLHYTDKPAPPLYLLTGEAGIDWPGRVEETHLLAAMLCIVKNHGIVEFHPFPGKDHGTCLSPSFSFMLEKILRPQNP